MVPLGGEHIELETLRQYGAAALEPEERERVAQHMGQCVECQAKVARFSGEATGEVSFSRYAPLSEVKVLQRGSVLGRYIVLDVLGAGGMGEVYVAIDPELDRKVAIKLVVAHLGGGSAGATAQARLLREAQAMAKLSHPNVVSIYDVGVVNGQVFLAMEFVSGQNLREWLAQQPRGWREVLEVFKLAGQGLQAAHLAGMVHRDFKPENVLIGKDGRVLVADLGLAHAADAGALEAEPHAPGEAQAMAAGPTQHAGAGAVSNNFPAPSMTQASALMGTASYMAPELLAGGSAGAASDQFAFAVSLYRALYGTPPFAGPEALRGGQVSPAPAGAQVPPWLRRHVLRGLRSSPAERFASMEELLAALGRDPAQQRNAWLLGAASLGVVAVLVGGVVALAARQQKPCTGAELKLAGVWDTARRQAIGENFRRVGPSYSGEVWKALEGALDRYASRWVQQHTATCEATTLRAEQSPEVLTLRMQCLEARLEDLRTLTTLLLTADAELVLNASKAPDALAELSQCEDVLALQRRLPLPRSKELLPRIGAAQRSLREARSLSAVRQFRKAKLLYESLAVEAKAIGYPPLEADVTTDLIEVREALGEPGVRDLAIEAVRLAELSGDDLNRFLAMLAVCRLNLLSSAALEHTLTSCSFAASVLPRIKDNARPTALHQLLLGHIYVTRNRLDEGLAAYQRGLAGLDPSRDDHFFPLAELQGTTAYVLRLRNKPRDALARELEVLEAVRKRYGPMSSEAAYALAEAANCHLALNELPLALKLNGEALAMYRLVTGPHDIYFADALRGRGVVLTQMGRFAEAQAALQESLDAVGGEGLLAPDTLSALAESLRQEGRAEEALPVFQRVHALYEKNGVEPPDDGAIGEARTLKDLQRYPLAQSALEAILAALEKAPFQDRAKLSVVRFELAQTLWELGRYRGAERALATAALDDVGTLQGDTSERKAAIARWLEAHPSPAPKSP